MSNEVIWRQVFLYEDLYTISEYGDVFSIRNKKLLKHSKSQLGYLFVTLSYNGKQKRISIHRLVALNFIKKITGKDFVNHKDGDKSNNHYSNLEWCTTKENNVHAYTTGLKVLPKGKYDKRSVPIIQMDLNGNFVKEWAGAREAQRIGGFRQSNIWHCLKGNQHKSQGFKWAYK